MFGEDLEEEEEEEDFFAEALYVDGDTIDQQTIKKLEEMMIGNWWKCGIDEETKSLLKNHTWKVVT